MNRSRECLQEGKERELFLSREITRESGKAMAESREVSRENGEVFVSRAS
jgi:hypothetical protein